ncbi:MAG: NADP-dependent phosphogluconate dehydrogenase, partial [Candidatus Binatia bacterium]
DGKPVTVAASLEELVANLEKPARIMLLVPAGKIVDMVLADLVPLLQKDDIVIDGGNSHFTDTDRRYTQLQASGIHFMGMGVSGGEEGARFGPSMMPGSNEQSFNAVKDILESIAAKTPEGACVSFIGNGAAGHYTKMVHNGIEYAMMQLISEVYGLLKNVAGLSNEELQQTFAAWNNSELQGFLIEITAEVFLQQDDKTGNFLVDMILDKAKQKGTGMWTSQSAMELNIPIPVIDAAVSMRYLSAMKEERVAAAGEYAAREKDAIINKEELVHICKNALHFAFILSYAQGLHLLHEASKAYAYNVNPAEVVRIWKGGCIIRSALLNDLHQAYLEDNAVSNVIHSPVFISTLKELRESTADLCITGINNKLPVAAFAASLNYFDAYCSERLPANLAHAAAPQERQRLEARVNDLRRFRCGWRPMIHASPQIAAQDRPTEKPKRWSRRQAGAAASGGRTYRMR